MDDARDRDPYLSSIRIVLPGLGQPIALGRPPLRREGAAEPDRHTPRTLAAEAMRWTFVLRTRKRWLDKGGASQAHEQEAIQTLLDFGITDDELRRIGEAARVVVRMPYRNEAEGWAGRIFPWEYVIASATRRYRRVSGRHFTVMRELERSRGQGPVWKAGQGPRSMLFVQSAPAALASHWEFDGERARIALALPEVAITQLKNPTLRQLSDKVAELGPDLVHLSGFDNVGGLRALRDLAPQTEPVECAGATRALVDLLSDERGVPDGFMLSAESGRAALVDARALAGALSAGGRHCAYFIALGVENSAARTAALLVAEGAAMSAVGFQDSIDDALVEFFFELIYTQLGSSAWHMPQAFEQAWLRARNEPNATRATGVTLWAGAPVIQRTAAEATALAPVELRARSGPPTISATPEAELNYSVLHNNGALFSQFVVERGGALETDWLTVDVELHLGTETARYSKRFQAARSRFDLSDEIHVPLTASLVRSAHEAVNSSLVVQLSRNDDLLTRDSHRLRLLPVDQWRDNDKDGQWLPSFVLPRDAAVVSAVEQAQRYVRVLRDDPNAGFEGYQAAPSADEDDLRQVDLQVQAIWATLQHEWRLGYINPPPTYSDKLDSQRLRTPSTVLRGRSGTCIDLALLFAACLELIDVYPVVFLLNGHALPGYWRHHQFQDDYRSAKFDTAHGPLTAEPGRNSSSSVQRFAWQALGKGAYREIVERIRARQLVPVETVRLTEHCGFVEAIEAGVSALGEPTDFHSVLDIVTARTMKITPLPIAGEPT